jgi:hypothetical protein
MRDIKSNRDNIGYAEHIFNTGYSCGTIEDMMEIIKVTDKGPVMNTVE